MSKKEGALTKRTTTVSAIRRVARTRSKDPVVQPEGPIPIAEWRGDLQIAKVRLNGALPTNVLGPCGDPVPHIYLAGQGRTNNQGDWVVNIADRICNALVVGFEISRVNSFIATAFAQPNGRPALLTVAFNGGVIDDSDDVTLGVTTWTPAGQRASGVKFAWQCILQIKALGPDA